MGCAWKQLLGILPVWLRQETDLWGREALQEIRLRSGAPPELLVPEGPVYLSGKVTRKDLQFTVNTASHYSPWAAATIAKGYLTAPGGHRIGLCGQAVLGPGGMTGLRDIDGLCIRVARDVEGIGDDLRTLSGSVLILGAPGWGKTTLLRNLARQLARKYSVCVLDERGELFPEGIPRGKRMDVLSGCPKSAGIEMLLRTMAPDYIALDEITAREDCEALLQAVGCGVSLIATAHASSEEDFRRRTVYRPLWEKGVFDHLVILRKDRTYTLERTAAWA